MSSIQPQSYQTPLHINELPVEVFVNVFQQVGELGQFIALLTWCRHSHNIGIETLWTSAVLDNTAQTMFPRTDYANQAFTRSPIIWVTPRLIPSRESNILNVGIFHVSNVALHSWNNDQSYPRHHKSEDIYARRSKCLCSSANIQNRAQGTKNTIASPA